MRELGLILLSVLLIFATLEVVASHGDQPLSTITVQKATFALHYQAYIKVSPTLLGLKGQNTDWVTVEFSSPNPSVEDWIGVFSPSNFSASSCPAPADNPWVEPPLLCSAPIKYQYANNSTPKYKETGKGSLKLQLINQRSDFSFASIFRCGYGIGEAVPFVEWGPKEDSQFVHQLERLLLIGTASLRIRHKSVKRTMRYTYKLGHILSNGTYVWSQEYKFRASPYPGQNSLQRVVIFGDMGKAEADGSNEYNDFQHGSLNTTKQLIRDLNNIDIAFLIGDICYANGYLSQWDQFTAQVEPIASTVPFMIASGNHERDWPGSGSFYGNKDSGGECGVLAETMFYVPTENRAKFWYSTDYGMFRFCVADTEHDWREGTEQYQFIEHCLASVDRQKQPWLIFLAHRVLGYSSATFYADTGSFGEPMGRESLQKLWQKYKVDIAIYGHAHHYERTCPIYQNICTNKEKQHYKGAMNGTIHVVAGGGGAGLAEFTTLNTKWSFFKDYDYGFVKLTAFDHLSLLFEYKKSSDGKVYDSFTISRDYRDILACTVDSCPSTTLAS
ncbi:hypothetical protein GOBAR_DD01585 [Gossypium barbadense]|nr:hypothetical protein GOBAR_DD01585 [Gossypium barbadense]